MNGKNYFVLTLTLLALSCQQPAQNSAVAEEIVKDLLGTETDILNVNCALDLMDGELEGNFFDFTSYHVSAPKGFPSLFENYPIFTDSLYSQTGSVEYTRFSKWQQTPLKGKDSLDYLSFANNLNVLSQDCCMLFIESNVVFRNGNYFAWVAGFHTGVWFVCYVPSENNLIVLRTRG